MDPIFLGSTMKTLGEVVLGLSVLRVHRKVKREQRIDDKVLSEIKTEQAITTLAIIFIISGYLLEIIYPLIQL